MKDKIRRFFAIAALAIVVGVLGLLAYAIYKWAGSTWEYFGSTALLILGGCFVVAGLIVLPFGVSLHLGDKRSQVHARAYVANLAKVAEPAVAGPVYTITQIDDPEAAERIEERNRIYSWRPQKLDDGGYLVAPFNSQGELMIRKALPGRYASPTEAWDAANEKRLELGWIVR